MKRTMMKWLAAMPACVMMLGMLVSCNDEGDPQKKQCGGAFGDE